MKIAISLVYVVIILFGIILIPNAFAENVPDWVKNTAGWWADDKISETEFVNAVEFLVKENIIQVDVSQTSETSQGVPDWVKNTAGWWASDAISESEFVNAIAFLIKVGIIGVESSKSPELIAEMWVNGDINDDEFLANVNQLIEKGIITVKSDSITKTSPLPDWLVNNAGWWAARILTNSDFDFDPGYIKEEIYPCEEGSVDHTCIDETYNSHGFRGDEFESEKPDNTFRIFAIGGSTTFGVGVQHSETWPVHLQQIIDEKIIDQEIEVINAGIPGGTTESEYDLIKNRISSLDPDLIIMYDGVNDYAEQLRQVNDTVQNWNHVCKLGRDLGFDTIIIIQPVSITGHRVLTEQEIVNSFSNLAYPYVSQQYVDAFEELDKICTKTADFRIIFDYIHEPIFWDSGHTISFGNKIIAENVFSVISPIYFGETHSVIHNNLYSENNEPETGVVYAVDADLSNRNFDNLNLQNAVFDKADLSNTSFKNANIDGARFVFANLSNSNLLDRTDLSNINLSGVDLSNVSLKGKDISGTMLVGVDLSYKDLTGADLIDTILTGADLTGTILRGADLSGKDMKKTILKDADLSNANLTGMDLSVKDLTGTILTWANLSNTNFQYANFDNTNLENANLTRASVVQVDLTNIKNKSLAGANLFDTSFAHSNLSGVNLSGAILVATNFWKADLQGQDFTVVSDTSVEAISFEESNLSNSNFEGVDLSPQKMFSHVFENKAHLKILSDDEIVNDIFGENQQILILSTEVRGNDLAVSFVYFNNFKDANLENANFKNAKLLHADFYSANLTNADLSGADLRKALFSNADLSNANLSGANLSGANLSGAIWDESTILKCLNHPICMID